MPRILNVKDNAVTVGVLDRGVVVDPNLIEITYADDSGTPHTIFAHRDGPFTDPATAVQAHRDGTLHAEPNEAPPPEEAPPPAGPVLT